MRRTDWIGVGLIAAGATMAGVNALGQSIPVATIAVESVPTPMPPLPPLRIPNVRFVSDTNAGGQSADASVAVAGNVDGQGTSPAISVVGTVVFRDPTQSWATVVDAGGFRTVRLGSLLSGSRIVGIDDGVIRLANGRDLKVAQPSYAVPGMSSFGGQTVPVSVAAPTSAPAPAVTSASPIAPPSAQPSSGPSTSSSFSQSGVKYLNPMALPTPAMMMPQSVATPNVLSPATVPTPAQLLPTGDSNDS